MTEDSRIITWDNLRRFLRKRFHFTGDILEAQVEHCVDEVLGWAHEMDIEFVKKLYSYIDEDLPDNIATNYLKKQLYELKAAFNKDYKSGSRYNNRPAVTNKLDCEVRLLNLS